MRGYPMPLAETASIFNECLISACALASAADNQEKLAILESSLNNATMIICDIAALVVMVFLALVSNSPAGMVYAMIYDIFSSLALPLETIMLSLIATDLFGNKSFDKIDEGIYFNPSSNSISNSPSIQ